jgi:hypothetical protein
MSERESLTMKNMKDMKQQDLKEYLDPLMRVIDSYKTPDTLGYLLVYRLENGFVQYASTMPQSEVIEAMRSVADMVESGNVVDYERQA